jgi:large subunit ribosomal protein L5
VAPRMKEVYETKVRAALAKRFGYTNPMQVPRLEKIVLNRGIGTAKDNPKAIEGAVADLTAISGQKPILTKARKSIAQFKLREGFIIGCQVTLRRDRMYEFFDRLVNFAIPQIRDFRGVSDRSFDGRGNFNLGLNEQLIFPEIDYDDIASIAGVTVTICTTAGTDEEGKALLSELGMPFRRPSR